jgi:autotransporter-associated beta strand protein
LNIAYSGGTKDTYSGLLGDSNGSRKANNFSVTKSGSGVFELTNANTYTGGTTVSGGTLLVSNTTGSALGSGGVLVNTGATLGGSGIIATTGTATNTINGNLQVGIGGSDTMSTMTLTATGTTSFANANLSFNLDTASTNSNSLAVGATHDVLFSNVTLTLNLQGSNLIAYGTEYTLFTGLTLAGGGLDNSGFGGDLAFSNDPTQMANALKGYTIDFTGFPAGTGYSPSYLILTPNGTSNGYNIDVVVVPEPGTWALMLGGLALLVIYQRARRSKDI